MPANWKPTTIDTLNSSYLCIREEGSRVEVLPILEKLQVWDKIYEEDDLLF